MTRQIDFNDFEEVISWDLLEQPKVEKELTLFDIAGFPHYELVISNFYAYFFDIYQPHGFYDLFITSLLNIASTKLKNDFEFNIKSFNTFRETRTNNNKLIDILLIEGQKDDDFNLIQEYDSAIVIEMKMYADLYNNLDEYLNSINSKNKLGIVLSLKIEKKLPKNYINITHNELLTEISNQGLSYLLQSNERQITIFRDFVKNMQNYYENRNMNLAMDKHIEFFLANGEKVKRLLEEYNNLLLHINQEIELVALENQFEVLTKRGSVKKTSVFGLSGTSLAWYIYLENIIYQKSFIIKLWIQQSHEAVKKWNNADDIQKAEYKTLAISKEINLNNTSSSDKNHWRKIATKAYKIDEIDIKDFREFFDGILKKDWLEIKDVVIKIL